MNRHDEYINMLRELEPPASLEATLERAKFRRKKQIRREAIRLAMIPLIFLFCFALLVNFCAPVAYACSNIPLLRELAEAVSFSRSLTAAVENDYVQPIELKQSENGISAEIAYLIVDQKQVNIFYRLSSEKYKQLSADPSLVLGVDGLGYSLSSNGIGMEDDGLLSLTVDFVDNQVPDSIHLRLQVYSNSRDPAQAPESSVEDLMFSDELPERPQYLADFDFELKFDPRFTAHGRIHEVNKTVILDGQQITIKTVEVYPSHMRVDISEAESNTAWLKDLYFHIESDWGMRFEPVSSGITATGSADSPSFVSYRADSSYFYRANKLELVISGAKWLRKDMDSSYINLSTGETGELPQGASFESAERQGSTWILTFRAELPEGEPMHQLFDSSFCDSEGNEYEINMWSSYFGEDENDSSSYFYDSFPLKNYPYDEVWLRPSYSHYWSSSEDIVVQIY
ncbi:MAG: DUF4179 domain-containing protein [Oscillospiraceae bacterium]|nr:DUF4179 domain-containing protein [Oscillospiraceae bacterium]